MSPLAYAIILLVIGVVLVILEVLLPSGGIISLFAGAAFIAALVYAFQASAAAGLIMLLLLMVTVPGVVILGFSILPKTPFGRRMTLSPGNDNDPAPKPVNTPGVSDRDFSLLQAKQGVAVTDLRPSGIAEIDDERYSVVAQCEVIPKGTAVEVIKIEGNSIVVDEVATA